MRKTVLAILLICAVALPGCGADDSPQQQVEFNQAIKTFAKRYDVATSAAQPIVRKQRKQAVMAILQGNTEVINWIGKIQDVRSSDDGFSIEIKAIDGECSFRTTETVIPKDGAIGKEALLLRVGDVVQFSGLFVPDPDDGIKECSITEFGGMKAPEFAFSFNNIKH